MSAPDREPTEADFITLSQQCTAREWEQLMQTSSFLKSCFVSLAATEKAASAFLGRKISATVSHNLKPSENETL